VTGGPLLAAEDLVVRYGRQEAVRGVSVSVYPGEVVGLIGPDGGGKTSAPSTTGSATWHSGSPSTGT